jgi:hypothetical protein
MQVFDASSMIYAWDNYPATQLLGLWRWMSEQIAEGHLVMSTIAFEEVRDKTPDCAKWLKDNNLKLIAIDGETVQTAMRIKGLLGIVDDKYHPKGVCENDILIIASARINSCELVSDEERQNNLPVISAKRKIPAVCSMTEVNVPCINYVEYFKRSNEVFG